MRVSIYLSVCVCVRVCVRVYGAMWCDVVLCGRLIDYDPNRPSTFGASYLLKNTLGTSTTYLVRSTPFDETPTVRVDSGEPYTDEDFWNYGGGIGVTASPAWCLSIDGRAENRFRDGTPIQIWRWWGGKDYQQWTFVRQP